MSAEVNGDLQLDRAERWRFLKLAWRQIRESSGAGSAEYYALRAPWARLTEGAAAGDSPLRIYSDAILAEVACGLGDRPVEILDIGCGRGHYAAVLAERGLRGAYLGLDIEAHDAWETSRGPIQGLERRYQVSSIESADLADAGLDFAFSSSALEHIADDAAAARQIFRALRSGGTSLHLVPAPWSVFLYGYHGWRRYDPAHLDRLFRSAGLEIVKIHRLGGLPSFLLHVLWIGMLETGQTTLILYDMLSRGGASERFRTRILNTAFGGARRGRSLRIYGWLLGRAIALDRYLPWCANGYAIEARKPGEM